MATRGAASALFANGSTLTGTVTWSGTQPAAGQKVLVYMQFNDVISALNTTLTDNGTTPRSFSLDKAVNATPGIYIWRADNITLPSAGNYAVSITMVSPVTVGTLVAGGVSYSGVAAGGPTATNQGSGTSTAPSAGAVTPAGAGALYFGAFADQSPLSAETITINWAAGTQQFTEVNGSSFWCSGCADSVSGTGAQTPAWTLGDNVAWVAIAAVYDAPASGATAVQPFQRRRRAGRDYRHNRRVSPLLTGAVVTPPTVLPPAVLGSPVTVPDSVSW